MKDNQIIIYKSKDGRVSVDTVIKNETAWLTMEQMTILFGKSKATINEHILNIFKEKEFIKGDVVRKIGNSDFSTKPTN